MSCISEVSNQQIHQQSTISNFSMLELLDWPGVDRVGEHCKWRNFSSCGCYRCRPLHRRRGGEGNVVVTPAVMLLRHGVGGSRLRIPLLPHPSRIEPGMEVGCDCSNKPCSKCPDPPLFIHGVVQQGPTSVLGWAPPIRVQTKAQLAIVPDRWEINLTLKTQNQTQFYFLFIVSYELLKWNSVTITQHVS